MIPLKSVLLRVPQMADRDVDTGGTYIELGETNGETDVTTTDSVEVLCAADVDFAGSVI